MEILSLHLSFICEYLDKDCSYDPFDELVIHSWISLITILVTYNEEKVTMGYAGANNKLLLDFYYWSCLWDKVASLGDGELTRVIRLEPQFPGLRTVLSFEGVSPIPN